MCTHTRTHKHTHTPMYTEREKCLVRTGSTLLCIRKRSSTKGPSPLAFFNLLELAPSISECSSSLGRFMPAKQKQTRQQNAVTYTETDLSTKCCYTHRRLVNKMLSNKHKQVHQQNAVTYTGTATKNHPSSRHKQYL